MGEHPELSRAVRLAHLALALGRVERVTRHEDGVRPETDTDHTVMLGLVACELAPPDLDRAMIAALSLVHDLVEAYAGDTQTLVISPEAAAEKCTRERAARARLVTELGDGSWLADLLATYEQQKEPEARFVRLVDKVLPKLAHAFNGCSAARLITDRQGFIDAQGRQLAKLQEEYPEFPEALGLLRSAMTYAEECWPAPEKPASALVDERPEPPDDDSDAAWSAYRERYVAWRASLQRRRGRDVWIAATTVELAGVERTIESFVEAREADLRRITERRP